MLYGCAAPGEPTERKPLVAAPVTDLALRQLGNNVILTFTMPKETAEQHPLKQTPAVEIYRSIGPLVGNPKTPASLVVTIPAAMTDQYFAEAKFRYPDVLNAADFPSSSGGEALYFVRTRVSPKKASADSNHVLLRIYPAPDPITDLTARFSRAGVALKWTPPKIPVGAQPEISEFHIYRADEETGPPPGAGEKPKLKAAPAQIGASVSTDYVDTDTEYVRTYVYWVRSVAKYQEASVESADSNWVSVTTKDVFPPAAPQGLVVVFVPAQGDTPAHLELSWAINSETDLAGYNVYRTEQVDVPGTRLNTELLRTPAFRDMNVVPGRRYLYSVTAVDRFGNESSASAAVPGGVPDDSGQTP